MKTAPARFAEHATRGVCALALCLASLSALPALAQSPDNNAFAGMLKPPRTGHSIGLNVGRSDYGLGCGALPGCEDSDRYLRLYGQSMVNEYWGAEVGVLDMGRIDLGSGNTRAQGVNLSVVGRVPLGEMFSAFGKVGTTFGHTSTSSSAGSGLRGGSENGFGLSYGAGLSWHITPRVSAVVEWDSHDFKFANGERDPVRATSLGLQFRY